MIILPTSGTVRVWAVPLVISLLVLSHPAKGQNKQQEQSDREQLGASGTATNSLQQLLKRFPKADKNQDGRLTWAELNQYRKTARQTNPRGVGVPTTFEVHPGWKQSKFPETSMSLQAPSVIREVWAKVSKGQQVPTYDPPGDGGTRVIGIGHSFMAPGYRTLPTISSAAGMEQPLYTHLGGGMTGSARYKWEQENGIFQFDGKPFPKILAAITEGKWDAMVFGPYFNDRPAYFECWIDFCLKYQPEMKFYLSDAWPQLSQFPKNPASEDAFTESTLDRLGRERRELSSTVLNPLKARYPGKVFLLPTSDAMVLAAKAQRRGELPGIEGVHRVIGGKANSIWRDQLGHLGPGLEWLEGYVFYSTLYQKPPPAVFPDATPPRSTVAITRELDQKFREIAWKAVQQNPNSGVGK